MRTLIIYPNLMLQYSLPHSVAALSATLKEVGDEVELFDTTMYRTVEKCDDEKRVERGQISSFEQKGVNDNNIFDSFRKVVNKFNPDRMMITLVDNTVELGLSLLRSLDHHIETIAGGVSVILRPDRFNIPEIDEVCTTTIEEYLLGITDINLYPMDDFSIFPEERLFRPMDGHFYKTIPLLSDRGCPYTCGFCCAPVLKKKFGYHSKTLERLIQELEYQVSLYHPNFIYFSSETFLAMPIEKLRKYADVYKSYNIPFWAQTHINTLTEEKVKLISEMGCHKLAIGIEHGNEEFRSKIINKHFSNNNVVKAFKLLKEYGIKAAANNIIGFPFETEKLIHDTIEINKILYHIMPDIQINGYIYQPYYGTALRDFCKDHGLLTQKEVDTVQGNPVIFNPYITDKKLMWYRDNFHRMVTS